MSLSLSLSLFLSFFLSLCDCDCDCVCVCVCLLHSCSYTTLILPSAETAGKNSVDLDGHTAGFELVYSMAGLGCAGADGGAEEDLFHLFDNLF